MVWFCELWLDLICASGLSGIVHRGFPLLRYEAGGAKWE